MDLPGNLTKRGFVRAVKVLGDASFTQDVSKQSTSLLQKGRQAMQRLMGQAPPVASRDETYTSLASQVKAVQKAQPGIIKQLGNALDDTPEVQQALYKQVNPKHNGTKKIRVPGEKIVQQALTQVRSGKLAPAEQQALTETLQKLPQKAWSIKVAERSMPSRNTLTRDGVSEFRAGLTPEGLTYWQREMVSGQRGLGDDDTLRARTPGAKNTFTKYLNTSGQVVKLESNMHKHQEFPEVNEVPHSAQQLLALQAPKAKTTDRYAGLETEGVLKPNIKMSQSAMMRDAIVAQGLTLSTEYRTPQPNIVHPAYPRMTDSNTGFARKFRLNQPHNQGYSYVQGTVNEDLSNSSAITLREIGDDYSLTNQTMPKGYIRPDAIKSQFYKRLEDSTTIQRTTQTDKLEPEGLSPIGMHLEPSQEFYFQLPSHQPVYRTLRHESVFQSPHLPVGYSSAQMTEIHRSGRPSQAATKGHFYANKITTQDGFLGMPADRPLPKDVAQRRHPQPEGVPEHHAATTETQLFAMAHQPFSGGTYTSTPEFAPVLSGVT